MSARDLFHDAVKRGLEKEGWLITRDPLELEWEDVKVKIEMERYQLQLIVYDPIVEEIVKWKD
jgi:XisH protein